MRKLKFESTEVEIDEIWQMLTDKEVLQEVYDRGLEGEAFHEAPPEQIDLTAAIDEFHWKKPMEALRRIEIAVPRLDGLGDAVARHFGARP